MSIFLAISIMCLFLTIVIGSGTWLLYMVYRFKFNSYIKECIEKNSQEHKNENSFSYATEKMHKWSLYNLWNLTNDTKGVNAALVTISISLIFFFLAFFSATEDFRKLTEKREKLAQDGAITQHVDPYEIAMFNMEVIETYSKVPDVDKKVFLKDKSKTYEKLLIPYDMQWYRTEIEAEDN